MKPQSGPITASEKLAASPETTRGEAPESSMPARRTRTLRANGGSDSHQQVFDLRRLLNVLAAARNGDFSVRLPPDWTGLEGKIADAFNDIMMANESMARELKRVS